ncbi:hypothetical protein HK105_208517 [Polyrhizophydium stewartii]|uniref:SHSP domain-containing protein n=1 Tax=Polyrhizophydium stewartii TaxID=2732419 RepID=A0ABR4MXM9_9FUNG
MSLVFGNRDPIFDVFSDPAFFQPWSVMERMERLNRAADRELGMFRPQVDVWDAGDSIKVHVDLPGVPKENVKADIDKNGNLVVEAESSMDREYDQFSARVRERRYGKFQRVIGLPALIDAAKITAKFENGVLDINVPKTTEAAKAKIQIA